MAALATVLRNVAAVRDDLPDQERVDELVTRARELIDSQNEARAEAKLLPRSHEPRAQPQPDDAAPL